MDQLWDLTLLHSFIRFFLLVGSVQLIHGLCGYPLYDIPYLFVITGLLVIGDALRRVRWITFALALFLFDLTPGFILIPLGLLLFFLRRGSLAATQNVFMVMAAKSMLMKMGVKKFF